MSILGPGQFSRFAELYLRACRINFPQIVQQVAQHGFQACGRGAYGLVLHYGSRAVKIANPVDLNSCYAHQREIDAMLFLQSRGYKHSPALFDQSGEGVNKLIHMQYLENYTTFCALEEDIAAGTRERPSIEQMQQLEEALFSCLAELHECGFAHADLKSDNAMIYMEPLDVKLIDFNKAQNRAYFTARPRPVSCYAPNFDSQLKIHSFEELEFLDYFAAAVMLWELANMLRITGEPLSFRQFSSEDCRKVLSRRDEVIDGCFGSERLVELLRRGFTGL